MDDSDKQPTETETILMALDQITQTIDVMTSVVSRLRNYLEEQDAAGDQQPDLQAEMQSDRILH